MTRSTGRLPEDVATLVRLSAALAAGDDEGVERELQIAAGHDVRQVDETIVQSCLFLGFPAALEAAARWRTIRGEDAAADADPLASPARASERLERGVDLCRRIYGTAYEALRASVADASPALDRLMVEVGYGTVLGRPGLEPARRELCLVAVLAAQARDRQLHSHLRGALRTGAPPGWVEDALEIGLERVGDAAAARIRDLWADVRRRLEPGGRNADVH